MKIAIFGSGGVGGYFGGRLADWLDRVPVAERPRLERAVRQVDAARQDFTAEVPDRRWVADISEFSCWDGKLYLAGIRDLVSFLKYDSSTNNPLAVAASPTGGDGARPRTAGLGSLTSAAVAARSSRRPGRSPRAPPRRTSPAGTSRG